MVRSEKKMVMAPEHKQARHYAQTMGWARSEWTFLSKPEQLKGFYGIVLYQVRPAERYKHRTPADEHKYGHLILAAIEAQEAGRIVRTNVANLK